LILERSAGFTTALEQVVANNVRQRKNTSTSYESLGTIPRAGYVMGTEEWVAREIAHRDLEEIPTIENVGQELPALSLAYVKSRL
jgi:hypothetical protein